MYSHFILECLEANLIVSRYRCLFAGHTLVGLAADCKDRKFYFSDINTGTISRASLDNTSDSQVIIDGKIQYEVLDLCDRSVRLGMHVKPCLKFDLQLW